MTRPLWLAEVVRRDQSPAAIVQDFSPARESQDSAIANL
jgi:hypothetical protein